MANLIARLFVPGFRLINGSHLNDLITPINNVFNGTTQISAPRLTTADALTATPSGNQANALALTAGINRVSTVGSANDSVKLLPAVAGIQQVVINDAATNSMQVFGSGTDTINDVATATGVAQAAGKTAIYSCSVAGKWYRNLSA